MDLLGSFTATILTLVQVATVSLDSTSAALSWRVTWLFGAMALSFTPIVVVGMRTVPAPSLRMGMGMLNLSRGLASVVGIAGLSILLEQRQRYHAQLLAQEQSQHMLELEPMVNRLHSLFLTLGDFAGMAQYKAMAVLNERLHTQAAVLAYQECYLGLALFYALLCIPVLLLHRNYTVPVGTQPVE